MPIDLTEMRTWTAELVAHAGREALTLKRRGPIAERKADGTTVTNIDRTIETLLREAITARYPGHGFYGEEYGHQSNDPNAPLWAIDPVDGTTNLASGLPIWSISVGVVLGNIPVVGVVEMPEMGESLSSVTGGATYWNGETVGVLAPGGELTSENPYSISSTCARTVDFSRFPAKLRITGSAVIDLCWTAVGRFHGCQSVSTSLYDVAAGICICNGTGAETRWLADGRAWSANEMRDSGPRPFVLVTAPPRTMEFVRERVQDPRSR